MEERFSVSMCVYGGDNPEWFQMAVNSIVNQTLMPAEVIIVADGPLSDSLDKVLSQYENNPIFHIVRLSKNCGHGKARRIGLKHCKYEYIALMDADDISVPRRFELQMKQFLKDKELDIVGGNISEFIGSPDNIVGQRIVPVKDQDIKEYMKNRCPMNQVTVMFKKSSVERVGGYIDWYCEEDYYLWIRMYLAGMKFCNCKEILVNVRTGKEQYQRRGGISYFKSEAKLQKYMLKNAVIGRSTYCINIVKRFIVQVILPNKIRGYVFQKFARRAAVKDE